MPFAGQPHHKTIHHHHHQKCVVKFYLHVGFITRLNTYVCVSMCACNHMALLKKPDTPFYIGDSGTEFHVDYNHIRTWV